MAPQCWFVPAFVALLSSTSAALTPSPISCIVASPDGKTVAANLGGGTLVSLFDIQSGKLLRVLDAESEADKKIDQNSRPNLTALGQVTRIAFSPDGRFVSCAMLSMSTPAVVWDLHQLQPLPRFLPAPNYANCANVHFTQDSTALVTFMQVSPNGEDVVVGWKAESGRELWRMKIGESGVESFSPDPASDLVWLAGQRNGKTMSGWYDLRNGKPALAPPKVENSPAAAPPLMEVDIDGKFVQVKGARGEMHKLEALDQVHCAIVVQDHLVVAAVNAGLEVWDGTSGKLLLTLGDPNPPALVDDSAARTSSAKPTAR